MSLQSFFSVNRYEVVVRQGAAGSSHVRAAVDIRVGSCDVRRAATGVGPMHALDLALRACLRPMFPEIDRIRLCEYTVSVVDSEKATAARVSVLVKATDGERTWDAGCVSGNIVDASFEALCSSVLLGLIGLVARRDAPGNPSAGRTRSRNLSETAHL